MFSNPGKSRTVSRVRHETAEARFLAKQLDLFAGSNISSPVRTERSEASTAGTGEEKLYVLVTRKVSPFKRKIAQKIGSKVSLTGEKIAQNLSGFRGHENGVRNA